MSRGHIRRRGKESWELKFDAGRDPATGKRNIRYHSFRGTKRQAQVKLAELIAAVGAGDYVEPSKIAVADHVRGRIDHWEASGSISPRTAQRYRQLLQNQIVPHIGSRALQKLKPADIEDWHNQLRLAGRSNGKSGLAARSIGHAHRVLSKALADAERNELIRRNVCRVVRPPKVEALEMPILAGDRMHDIVANLVGRPLECLAITALFTGMRLGELLAQRWRNVDIDVSNMVRVVEALEETRLHGLRTKAPKTAAGVRDISLPKIVIEALTAHRRRQSELRLQLGLGKPGVDALVFPTPEAGYQAISDVSRQWGLEAARMGIPEITFHSLRHTHASQLIDAGVDVVTISRRLGHANPTTTLGIYAHLFRKTDAAAADAINAALSMPVKP